MTGTLEYIVLIRKVCFSNVLWKAKAPISQCLALRNLTYSSIQAYLNCHKPCVHGSPTDLKNGIPFPKNVYYHPKIAILRCNWLKLFLLMNEYSKHTVAWLICFSFMQHALLYHSHLWMNKIGVVNIAPLVIGRIGLWPLYKRKLWSEVVVSGENTSSQCPQNTKSKYLVAQVSPR